MQHILSCSSRNKCLEMCCSHYSVAKTPQWQSDKTRLPLNQVNNHEDDCSLKHWSVQTFTHTLKYGFTRYSGNRKTGRIPVTTSPMQTCPSVCPLRNDQGCYACSGGPLAIYWKRLNTNQTGISYSEMLDAIVKLPNKTYWRHNQAGDLAGLGNYIDPDMLRDLLLANKGKHGFTYTHKPLFHDDAIAQQNAELVHFANREGFTINISCERSQDALQYLQEGYPVTIVLPSNTDVTQHVIKLARSTTIIICPAYYCDTMTCSECKLCQKATRHFIIGFPAHGNRRKKVDLLISI
jgi:hypothetical protein